MADREDRIPENDRKKITARMPWRAARRELLVMTGNEVPPMHVRDRKITN